MNPIDAVLFDLDNTLLDRRASFRKFCEAFLAEHFPDGDLPGDRERMIAQMTELDRDGYGSKTVLYDSLIANWGLKGVSTRELLECHHASFCRYTTPDPDMDLVLNELSARVPRGLVTNGTSAGQNEKIDRLGIRGRFGAILVSGDLGIHKPDARIFHLCCEALGVAPSRAVYVGDHYENDVLGAFNAGLKAIWYPNDPVSPPVGVEAVSRLGDILNLL